MRKSCQKRGKNSRIVLVGMMGAGKTTIGRLIAARQGWRFIDSDAEIEKNMRDSIAGIFEKRGEKTFRKYERQTIQRLLREEHIVLALGGGAFCDETTRMAIRERAASLWLRASPRELAKRLGSPDQTETRPLLKDAKNIPETLANILHRRESLYAQCDHAINTDGMTPTETADAILALLAETSPQPTARSAP